MITIWNILGIAIGALFFKALAELYRLTIRGCQGQEEKTGAILLFVVCIGGMGALGYLFGYAMGDDIALWLDSGANTERARELKAQGWVDTEEFFSDASLVKAYPAPNFPVKLSNVSKIQNGYEFKFTVSNNFTQIISIYINGQETFTSKLNVNGRSNKFLKLLPQQKETIKIILAGPADFSEPKFLFDVSVSPPKGFSADMQLLVDANNF